MFSRRQIIVRNILRRCYSSTAKPAVTKELSESTLRRNQRRVQDFETNIQLAEQFKSHRNNIIEILKDEANIDALFENNETHVNGVNDYDELQKTLGKLSYNDIEMRNTILLVCHSLVESLYVEETLRKLDDGRLKNYLEEIKSSFDFGSFKDYRLKFVHFKSSQFLNHPDSDIVKEVDGNGFVKFGSYENDSSKYITRFKESFAKYEQNKNYTKLGVNIVKDLLHGPGHIPTAEIWSYLLDKFDHYKLHNFQQIIYESLFQYKHQPTVLATPRDPKKSKPQLMADHFIHLIESYPEILSSLCKYQETRNDKETFIELLSFLKLDKLAGEVMVLKSPLLSIAKFKLPQKCPGIELDSKLLTISRDCLYSIMKSSINLGLHEYVDLLYDKIVLDSIDPNNIQLNYVQQKLVEGKIFTPELFLIILESCKKSDNLGRVSWVLPFLDEYIALNKNIPQELKDSIIEVLTIYNLEGKLLSYKKLLCT
ncbi:hypothetical protein K4I79_004552 [Candida tropicalis]